MINNFSKYCASTQISTICTPLIQRSNQAFVVNNGNILRWRKSLETIKQQKAGKLNYAKPYLHIDTCINQATLQKSLENLIPWRKGPYQIGNLQVDSEWRGDMKWDRLSPYIRPLKNKTILDVGSGNGYFTYLMAMEGADIALGIEPFLLFNYQFQAIRCLIKDPPKAFVLPLSLEQMPDSQVFDTIFSMGVLYHQKKPLQHLHKLKNLLTKEGELVLETLIIDKKHGTQIIPKNRYAKMRNVYCLPSVELLQTWLTTAGFKAIKLVDINQTSFVEQCATRWIGDNAQSLQDFLNPDDINLTIEGLPAPRRALFICHKNV